MLIELKRLDEKSVFIDSVAIFRLRPAIPVLEPNAVSVVHYDTNLAKSGYQSLSSNQSIKKTLARMNKYLPMAKLTAPNGDPVYLDASKVFEILPPTEQNHHDKTKALVFALGHQQQVRETVEDAGAIIKSALKSS